MEPKRNPNVSPLIAWWDPARNNWRPNSPIVGLLKRAGTGASVKLLAQANGVPAPTVETWLSTGRRAAAEHEQQTGHIATKQSDLANERDRPYWQFAHDFDQARANAALDAIGKLQDHGQRDWRAINAWLDRAHPTDNTTPKPTDHKGEVAAGVRQALQSVAGLIDAVTDQATDEQTDDITDAEIISE